ncbi:MAG: hypothetical protein ACYS9X_14870 [Planctomycetota bacterium]|jgi:hypothetical protein
MGERKIVLMSVAPGSDSAVAGMLAEAFGIPRKFAERIVESAPIVLLKRLPRERAAAALEAMAPVRRAGAEIVVTDKELSNVGELNWPRPPLGGPLPFGGPPSPEPPLPFQPGDPSLN